MKTPITPSILIHTAEVKRLPLISTAWTMGLLTKPLVMDLTAEVAPLLRPKAEAVAAKKMIRVAATFMVETAK
jgi:hypothetical protein